MSKQDVIKSAYGEFWSNVNGYVDKNGWCSIYYEDFGIRLFGSEAEFYNFKAWRPKSLSGIENNRGWVKIESENDLPKEDIECWVLDDEEIVHAYFMYESKNWYSHIDLNLRLFPTHYQPIIKPKPPIY